MCLPQGRRLSADFRPWKSKTTSTPRAVLFDLLIALLETCASSTAISRPTRTRIPMAVPVWARSRISPDGTAGCRAAGRCGAASTRSSRAGFDAAHAFHRPRDATAHRGRASSRGPRSAPHARASEAPARVGEGPRAPPVQLREAPASQSAARPAFAPPPPASRPIAQASQAANPLVALSPSRPAASVAASSARAAASSASRPSSRASEERAPPHAGARRETKEGRGG